MSTPATYARIATPALERRREQTDASPARADSRPHVCFVAPDTWPLLAGDWSVPLVGGAEVQQSLLSQALARRGFRVSMITLDFGQPDRTAVNGVEVHKLYKADAGLPVLRFVHPKLTTLWRVLRRVNADVYYQRTASVMTGFVAHFCRRNGKRFIYSGASSVDFIRGKQDIAYARDRWIFEYGLRHADRIFAQNEGQCEDLRRHYRREATLFPNCYAPPAAGAGADRNGYILWAGTVRPLKQPEVFLDIARRLPQHRFVMMGGPEGAPGGEEYARGIQRQAEALPNVEYRGFLPYDTADRQFDGARLFVNTSTHEGFPNTFLQAWARGIPTVATIDTHSTDEQGVPVYDVAADPGEAAAMIAGLMQDDARWEQASLRVAGYFRHHHSLESALDLFEREVATMMPPR